MLESLFILSRRSETKRYFQLLSDHTTTTTTTKKAKLENIVLGECPICFEDVYKNTNVGHACQSCPSTCGLRTKNTFIHDDCMRKSVQLNGKCPVCQTTCVDPAYAAKDNTTRNSCVISHMSNIEQFQYHVENDQ